MDSGLKMVSRTFYPVYLTTMILLIAKNQNLSFLGRTVTTSQKRVDIRELAIFAKI